MTGGAGFIGSHLCRTLLAQGFRVYVVDNFITGRKENLAPFLSHRRFHLLRTDVSTPRFKRAFRDISVSRIYHLACPTGVPNIALLGPEMLLTCSLGTLNVLDLARQHQARVLFTSSCEVYGQPAVFPQSEEYHGDVNPVGPRSPYEEGKRFAESLIVTLVKHHALDARIVRIFNAYGPGMSPHDQRVLPQFLNALAAGQPLRVYGSGEQQRTFVYIDDLIAGLQLAMEHGTAGTIYNIGGDTPITMKQLADLLFQLADFDPGLSFQPHFIEDHFGRLPLLTKIAQLGWKQTVALPDGLRRMMAAWGIRERVTRPKKSQVFKQDAPVASLN